MIKHIFSVLLLSAVISTAHAQTTRISTSEANGNAAYNNLLYADALQYYRQAHRSAKSEQASQQLAAKIADCFWQLRNYDSAYRWYASIPSATLAANKKDKIRFAELSANMSKYKDAVQHLSNESGYADRAAGFNRTHKMTRDSVHWSIQYLDGINTDYFREFSPVLIDSQLIWTTNQPKSFSTNGVMGWDNRGYNRLMKIADLASLSPIALPDRHLIDLAAIDTNRPARMAKHFAMADAELNARVSIPPSLAEKLRKIQTMATPLEYGGKLKYNVAHASYSANGKQLVMTANLQGNINNATRMLSIAASTLNGITFTQPGFVLEQSLEYSNMHPAVHPDGNVVVFSSNRLGGQGGFDLYMMTKDENGNWKNPTLVTGVNTIGNELFPTFGADGKFYFSSDGLPGLGGLDIYTATFANGAVSEIMHVSYPLNSAFDDFGVTISADGTYGYFSSDRLGTDDVYSFKHDKQTLKISGSIVSKQTKKGKPDVDVTIIQKNDVAKPIKAPAVELNKLHWGTNDIPSLIKDNAPDLTIETVKSDVNGNYSFGVRPNRSYVVIANDGKNPIVTTKVMSPQNTSSFNAGVVEIDDIVEEPKKPEFVTQRFIVYFAFDKADIRQQYAAVLDQVAAVLKANPEVICALDGHTDQFGQEKYNDGLSAKRVEAAKAYLQAAGISADRLKTDSFGEHKLIQLFKNISKAEINRRVEITLKTAN